MAIWMGVLALERTDTGAAARTQLTRACAERIVGALLSQIARLLPGEHVYGFAWAAALFDPAQLLRRGFPVHQEIADLFAAGREKGLQPGQSLSLTEHQAKMPTALLTPDASLAGGPLLTIPLVLTGTEEAIAAARAQLEERLYDEGLADAGIVLELQADLKLRFEHVRWLSLLDLAAMMAAQLEHVGFAPAWTLIEEWLYSPAPQPLTATTASGLSLSLGDGRVSLPFEPFSAFARGLPAHDSALDGYLERIHEFRQLQALFAAHGLPQRVRLPHDEPDAACSNSAEDFLVEQLQPGECVAYTLHRHPGLGALAWTGLDAQGQIVEHRYPLSPAAIDSFQRELAARGIPVSRPGRVLLSADGRDLAATDEGA